VRHKKTLLALVIGITLTSFSTAHALNCVQFVKSATQFALSGNAWQWWGQAAGLYPRGETPRKGSVLVFKQTHKMHAGHVAVVASVLDDHTVLLDHANWGYGHGPRGKVDRGIEAVDCSLAHDWSRVCVFNKKFNVFGAPYPIYGFIYPAG